MSAGLSPSLPNRRPVPSRVPRGVEDEVAKTEKYRGLFGSTTPQVGRQGTWARGQCEPYAPGCVNAKVNRKKGRSTAMNRRSDQQTLGAFPSYQTQCDKVPDDIATAKESIHLLPECKPSKTQRKNYTMGQHASLSVLRGTRTVLAEFPGPNGGF